MHIHWNVSIKYFKNALTEGVAMNRWKWNQYYRWPPWLRRLRDGFEVFVLPLAVFQMIRAIFWPTTFDVVVLIVLVGLYICFLKRWI